jgi:hypothetical protein
MSAGAVDAEAASAVCPTATTTGQYVLKAEFARVHSPTLSTTYGDSAIISGSLRNAAGEPVADATLCMEEDLIGAGLTAGERIPIPRFGLARTDSEGRYVYRVPAGPNREIKIDYRNETSETVQEVRYFSTVRPTFQVSPTRARNRGRPVEFWGKLPGPLARGHVVVLQALARPNNWLTFRQITTDAGGRFYSSYRFTHTFGPVTFTLRALVPKQAGYPWLSGSSHWIHVHVNEGGR